MTRTIGRSGFQGLGANGSRQDARILVVPNLALCGWHLTFPTPPLRPGIPLDLIPHYHRDNNGDSPRWLKIGLAVESLAGN